MVPVISIEWPAFVCSACLTDCPQVIDTLLFCNVVVLGEVVQGKTMPCLFPSPEAID